MEVRWGVADLVHVGTTIGVLADEVSVNVTGGFGPLGRPPLLDDVGAVQRSLHIDLGGPEQFAFGGTTCGGSKETSAEVLLVLHWTKGVHDH